MKSDRAWRTATSCASTPPEILRYLTYWSKAASTGASPPKTASSLTNSSTCFQSTEGRWTSSSSQSDPGTHSEPGSSSSSNPFTEKSVSYDPFSRFSPTSIAMPNSLLPVAQVRFISQRGLWSLWWEQTKDSNRLTQLLPKNKSKHSTRSPNSRTGSVLLRWCWCSRSFSSSSFCWSRSLWGSKGLSTGMWLPSQMRSTTARGLLSLLSTKSTLLSSSSPSSPPSTRTSSLTQPIQPSIYSELEFTKSVMIAQPALEAVLNAVSPSESIRVTFISTPLHQGSKTTISLSLLQLVSFPTISEVASIHTAPRDSTSKYLHPGILMWAISTVWLGTTITQST